MSVPIGSGRHRPRLPVVVGEGDGRAETAMILLTEDKIAALKALAEANGVSTAEVLEAAENYRRGVEDGFPEANPKAEDAALARMKKQAVALAATVRELPDVVRASLDQRLLRLHHFRSDKLVTFLGTAGNTTLPTKAEKRGRKPETDSKTATLAMLLADAWRRTHGHRRLTY